MKPVLKEYEFEPRSKLITVKEGAEELVEVTAKRIAFSLYGSVTGLKGEPEAGVTMEAIGQGECTKYQEEATTGQVTSKNLQIFIQLSFHVIIQDGKLRIRGLQPSCSYQLGLKSTRSNIHVERTIPATRLKTFKCKWNLIFLFSRLLTIGKEDVTGVSMIAIRPKTNIVKTELDIKLHGNCSVRCN